MRRYGITRMPMTEKCYRPELLAAGVDSLWVTTHIETQLLDNADEIHVTIEEFQSAMWLTIQLLFPEGHKQKMLEIPICDVLTEWIPFAFDRNDQADKPISLFSINGYAVPIEKSMALCNNVIETDETWKIAGSDRWSRRYEIPADAKWVCQYSMKRPSINASGVKALAEKLDMFYETKELC